MPVLAVKQAWTNKIGGVGRMPLDVLVYRRDSLAVPQGFRIHDGDPYFERIRAQWGGGLRQLLGELPDVPGQDWD